MRPQVLSPLFADVATIKGVGEKTARLMAKLLRSDATLIARLIDVLLHLPSQIVDRRFRCTISQLPLQGIATLEVTIGQHRPPPRGTRLPYRISAHDETGSMSLVFFSSYSDYLSRSFPEGQKRLISGEIGWFKAEAQMTHPDYVLNLDEASKMPELEALYPLTEGLTSKIIRRVVQTALAKFPELPEWQDTEWLRRKSWPGFSSALHAEHEPQTVPLERSESPNRQRLAYDELLANQLALSLVRAQIKKARGRVLLGNGLIRSAVLMALPYQLTGSQEQALKEIQNDMAAPLRMLRLLQGDVGSGKTVVALLALVTAVECGTQGALMAPTEILVRQHYAGFLKLVSKTSLRFAILTGREKGKARDDILAKLANGQIDILVGTHAIFQEGVAFHDLGLAVIDEQHRFGVHQRLALQSKSEFGADLLVMTATPIPRTLALTAYGDLDVSKLTEKPAGRQPIDTRAMPMSRLDEIVGALRRGLDNGARVYWVCPLVEESMLVDLAAVEQRFEALHKEFQGKVGLVHGRMKGAAKDAVMADFKSGALSILVATTVIEVGVDVPEASIMVIENAERFGLAQLHQLRGRVGRGQAKSSCLLLYQEPLGEVAKARLTIMRETEDGFRIAEEDLKLRGAGEMLGTAQSGLPTFKIADLSIHGELLAAARDDAVLILNKDPKLQSARGEALRNLLYLFERDEAVKLLASG